MTNYPTKTAINKPEDRMFRWGRALTLEGVVSFFRESGLLGFFLFGGGKATARYGKPE